MPGRQGLGVAGEAGGGRAPAVGEGAGGWAPGAGIAGSRGLGLGFERWAGTQRLEPCMLGVWIPGSRWRRRLGEGASPDKGREGLGARLPGFCRGEEAEGQAPGPPGRLPGVGCSVFPRGPIPRLAQLRFPAGMISRAGAWGGGPAGSRARARARPERPAPAPYLCLLRSFLPSPRPDERTVVAGRREGPERGGGGGGWARCRCLSLPPGNLAFWRSLKEERLDGKPEREDGDPGAGGGGGLLGLLGPARGGGWGSEGWVQFPSVPSRHTYSFIPSRNAHLSGPVCASHCAGRGGGPGLGE